jgi:hypothetical protein
MNERRANTPLHRYLEVLNGKNTSLIYEIPRFYDLVGVFMPFTNRSLNDEMADLGEEDPLKVGKTPDLILGVLELAGWGMSGNEKNLEYSTIRNAYNKHKKSLARKARAFFGNEKIPRELEAFRRINETALDIGNYLGRVDRKFLHPNVFRSNATEFF